MTVTTSPNRSTKAILWIVLIAYMAVLIKLILVKKSAGYIKQHISNSIYHFSWKAIKANMRNGYFNAKPFVTIKMYIVSNMPPQYSPVSNLLGNVVGFIPLGILLPLLFPRLRSATATIFCVLLVSFCFEVFQLLTMTGVCDIDDLILNTAGGIIGYLFFLLIKKVTAPRQAIHNFV